jgi:predicted O-methyltransferase YrrM
VIVVDNVVRKGKVIDPGTVDANVDGVRRFHERLALIRGISATTVQTVGSKGYDGFTLAVVTAE